jgi:acetyl-CoA acetyltransferase
MNLVGWEAVKKCAMKAYEKAGFQFEKAAEELDVVELHDCFSTNELVTYEALGLAPKGKAHLSVDKNEFTYGGKVVVNPSGGLISKGHPISASGIAQCNECCW